MLRVRDEWAAYDLDVAAMMLGRQVEAARERGESVESVLEGDNNEFRKELREQGRFADPRVMVKRKMVIPPSGIW